MQALNFRIELQHRALGRRYAVMQILKSIAQNIAQKSRQVHKGLPFFVRGYQMSRIFIVLRGDILTNISKMCMI